jgi:DNA/RNA endonuclease YhcR with UshA esterase domain
MLRSDACGTRKIIFLQTMIVVLALTLIISPASIAASPTRAKLISIDEARALQLGTEVMIEGVVTVPSGAFKSSISDEGFAIQDRGAGIYVSVAENHGLRVGQKLRVTGRLVEQDGMLAIVPAGAGSIEVRGHGPEVQAQYVRTGKVGEATEGRLVKVKGEITRPLGDDSPYGFRLFINDGTGEIQVFISASTGINPRGLQMGARVSVTGLSGQYKDHYEISPRFAADIKPLPRTE